MQTNTIINEINETLDKLYEFVQTDSAVKDDFNEYKRTVGAKDVHDCVTYFFERRIEGESIPELFLKKSGNNTEAAKALSNVQSSLYEVKRVLKHGFILYNVINEKTYTVNSLTKMTLYGGIGIGHYVVARIFELKGEHYLLEISGILASNRKDEAMRYAVAKILHEPHLVYAANAEKQAEIEANIEKMYNKFLECFGSEEIVTTNKLADEIIGMFNDYAENGSPVDLEGKIQEPETYKYFEIKGLENDYNNFIEKSLDGFASHSQTYDTGIIYDKEYGLFVVPFYKTIGKILDGETIENADECIKYFLNADSIAPCVLKRIFEKHGNFVDEVNRVIGEKLTFDEVLKKFKPQFLKQKMYSHTTVLYNSNVFSNTLGIVVEEERKSEIDYSNVRRNDPCPCGSGKKFKHCCLD